MQHYTCIVLGVGGVGSSVLLNLARQGVSTLGIEQFEPGHDQGSSHGDTRIFRLLYFEHPDYVPLLRASLDGWHALNAETETPVFHQTGIAQSGPEDGEIMQGLLASAKEHAIPMEYLSADEFNGRYPGVRAEHPVILDQAAGITMVEQTTRLQTELAMTAGARLMTNSRVQGWRRDGKQLVVATDTETVSCDKLVICAGAWNGHLVPWLRDKLTIRRKALFWFDNDQPEYRLDTGLPIFLFETGPHLFYGFPQIDDKGVKVGDHAGGTIFEAPELIDRSIDTEELEAASLFLRNHLPGVGHQLIDHATCMYTMSPDGHFILGALPDDPDVLTIAGLSGHGYKFVPVFGEIIADLVIRGQTDHSIDFLSPHRFV